jgi:hypothetical protein
MSPFISIGLIEDRIWWLELAHITHVYSYEFPATTGAADQIESPMTRGSVPCEESNRKFIRHRGIVSMSSAISLLEV